MSTRLSLHLMSLVGIVLLIGAAACRRSVEDVSKTNAALSPSFGLTRSAAPAPSNGIVYIQLSGETSSNGGHRCLGFRTQEADHDHTAIQLLDCSQVIPQQFELVKLDNGMYRLRSNYRRDKYVGGWAVEPGNAVGVTVHAVMMPLDAAMMSSAALLFQWHLVPADNTNTEFFLANIATGLCLDIKDYRGEGTQQDFCNSSGRQRWKLIPA